MSVEFAHWLQKQLIKRQWDQKDLLSRMKDHQISQGQLSRIIKGTRQAGPEACIAIAHALEISREEVFIVRGWLLREFESPSLDPRALELAKEVSSLPVKTRELALEIIEPVLGSMHRLSNEIEHLPLKTT